MTDYTKLAYSCILVYLVVCTYKDLTVQTSADKHIPMTKVGFNANIGPTLKFLYCYSCGYRRAFEDYSAMIKQKYPEISITGSNYDPPGFKMLLARTFGIMKMVIIAFVLSGINPFERLGVNTPSWWNWCRSNRIWACMMVFFMSNALEGSFILTGAFEISLNDIPVWSKLETGRIPQPPELFQILENHMILEDRLGVQSDFPK